VPRVTQACSRAQIGGRCMSAAERESEIERLKNRLAERVETFNTSGDPIERAEAVEEIRHLRRFLAGLPGCDVGGVG
jgi:hypothetical protein